MSAMAVAHGRTLKQLASAMGRNENGKPISLRQARALIEDMEAQGLLDRVGPNTWRLSDTADELYGYWLRQWG